MKHNQILSGTYTSVPSLLGCCIQLSQPPEIPDVIMITDTIYQLYHNNNTTTNMEVLLQQNLSTLTILSLPLPGELLLILLHLLLSPSFLPLNSCTWHYRGRSEGLGPVGFSAKIIRLAILYYRFFRCFL